MATKVTVDYKEARARMRARFRRAEDFQSVFRWAHRELMKANLANFSSQGAASGKPWAPLESKYAKWKLENYGPLPILIVSGSMADSLVRLRGAPNEINKKSAVFGTDIPYARFHQTGTRKMAERKVMFVPPLFAAAMSQRVLNHILYGKLGVVSAPVPLLKGQI